MPPSIKQLDPKLTGSGETFEVAEADIRGQNLRIWKNAPPNLLAVLELSRTYGDSDFIVYENERLNFNDHYALVARFATALVEDFGIQKGDRVALAMRNFPEWSVVFWAVTAIGGIIVPLNAWWVGEELTYGLKDSGAVLLVCDQEREHRLAGQLGSRDLRAVVVARSAEDVVPGHLLFENVLAAHKDAKTIPDVEIGPEDDATIFYTSGTTGDPKGALGTHRNILTNLMSTLYASMRGMLRLGPEVPAPEDTPKPSMLLSVPLFHATGSHSILVPVVAQGGKLVMMHRWDPVRAMELIEEEKISRFGGVPTMVWQVLEAPEFGQFDLSSVTGISYGGSPAAPELVTRIKAGFPDVQPGNGYGLTETSAATTLNGGVDYIEHPDSVGPALPICDVKVMNEAGEEVPVGDLGELWIRGPNVVKGYWNKPEATAEAITDGWLHSGDIARIDDEGFVYIVDRAKDMIIRGGENVYCVEVEGVLFQHPAVMDAAVIGLPHKVLGEEVGAVVQIAPGMDVTERQLQDYASQHLASFKVPIHIDMRSEPLPRNANGKVLKRDLREEVVGQSA